MKFSLFASALALVSTAFAAPLDSRSTAAQRGCIRGRHLQQLFGRFEAAFQHLDSDLGSANTTLQTILADNFVEISDSVLDLESRPLGGDSASTKAEYISGLLGNPAATGLNTIVLAPVGCYKFVWQWMFTGAGDGVNEVKGFNMFEVNSDFQIETLWVEFNSIAWGENIGWTATPPPPSNTTTPASGSTSTPSN